ncbi:MAG: Nif3-like dinuclear metal center hexameric protein [Anaerohalosphaeraceae bacterium]|nr:Nif3-like dinuclear metal center hexameric protein [Anaerohalosphaeraceae bacterium]
MNLKTIIAQIEQIAPPALAQSWDNVGLLVGDSDAEIEKILMTIDVTASVAAEAKRAGCGLILSYHPVIWDGLKSVTASGAGGIVYKLVRENIAVYSMHTSVDVIAGGVNDGLADMVGIKDARPIGDFVSNPAEDNYKLIVFVPTDSVNAVADAMFAAGAGAIGNYSKCSFRGSGVGTFEPMEGSRPAIGKKGKLERVDEVRLESIAPAAKIERVVEAMRNAHPYEMPAFDVVKLHSAERIGLGRMGELAEPVALEKILANIKKAAGAEVAGIVGRGKGKIKKAAVCAGSCGAIVNNVIAEKCDLYITGELKHHQALACAEAGIVAVCLSHSVSERFILKKIAKDLQKKLKGVKMLVSKKDKDPFNWIPLG